MSKNGVIVIIIKTFFFQIYSIFKNRIIFIYIKIIIINGFFYNNFP